MKEKRKYRPPSWSEQARRMGDALIDSLIRGYSTHDEIIKFFEESYRNPIVRNRAAKRVGRWNRKERATYPKELIEHIIDICDDYLKEGETR